MRLSEYRLGLVLVTVSAIAWSTAGFFTRLILLDNWTMLAWRGVFGAIGLFAVIVLIERRQTIRHFRELSWPGWLFAAVSGIGMVMFITAFQYTSVAHVAVIYATAPLVAAGLGWSIMHERPAGSAILASLVALAGVLLMVGFGLDGSLFGDLLAFGMTLAVAVAMIIARRFQNIHVTTAACLSALFSGLACWPFGQPLAVSAHDLLLLFLFGTMNSAIGLGLFTFGARLLPPVETALIGALDAPLAPLWVWLAFDEVPDRSTILGGLLVLAAVSWHFIVSSRSARV